MTAYGSYHLPDDTDPVQIVLDRLEGEGLEVLASERNALSAVAVMGHLSALEHLIHRAMLVGSPAGQAATARQWVREQREDARPASHRATFRAPEPRANETRDWWLDLDGLGYTHRCGYRQGGFVDSRQTTEMAVAHHNQCPEVPRDR